MTVLLVVAVWLGVSCLAAALFSALMHGAGAPSRCLDLESGGPADPAELDAQLPAPRASTEDRQPTRV